MIEKTVYAFIRGGLGNQLFIYAAAKRIAIRNSAQLVLLNDSYENEPHGRHFLLDHFEITGHVSKMSRNSTPFTMDSLRKASRLNRYYQWISRFPPGFAIERNKTIFGRHQAVDRRFLDTPCIGQNLLVYGMFQSEDYFKDIKKPLRIDLQLKAEITPKTRDVASQISEANSVCLHFRRTEIEQEAMRKKHGNVKWLDGYRQGLELSYYQKAVEIIGTSVTNPHYFCFSDSPAWVRENFNISAPVTYVTHNKGDDKSHEDLYLMSLCRHHVISHSTFSWWGAWLCSNEQQIVVCPINVLGRPKPPFFPDRWHKIPVELPRSNT